MAKPGDRIYFGKCVNASVDTVWVVGVVADDRSDAIERIKANIDDEETELITSSVDNCYELYENLDEDEQESFKDRDFFLYDPNYIKI